MARTPSRDRPADAYGNAARELAPAFESAHEACFFVYFDLQIGFLNAAARRDIEAQGGDPATFIGARLWDALGYTPDMPARQVVEWVVRQRKPVSFSLRGSVTDTHWVENDVVPLSGGLLIWYRDTGPVKPQSAGDHHEDSSESPAIRNARTPYQAVQRLAGGIAHDFNNLLTAIKVSAAELQEPDIEPSAVVECAKDIEHAADRAAALTAQMLAFGRRQLLRPRLFDIGAHLRTIESALAVSLDGIGTLRVDMDRELGSVFADPSQVERAILNLVANARDAVRGRKNASVIVRGRNVELSGEFDLWLWGVEGTPGPFVRIDVEDNGPGVAEAALPHLFEPFYSTKGQGPAAGLGLATAYGIVKQSNGYIWAHPAKRGGAVFSVYLPRVTAATSLGASAPAPVRAAASADAGGNERILLVEDEDAIRRAAKRSLELAGYRITEAADGAAALQLAEDNEFDLLLTDVEMPKMLGTTLVERLKDSHPKLPVLFMSGHSDQLLRDGAIDSTTPFIAKPFTPPQLAEKVRETLARSRSKAR